MASTPLTNGTAPTRRAPLSAVAPVPCDVSVLIVSWNSSAWVGDCLDALAANEPAEVIVFDNASRDNTVAEVEKRDQTRITLLHGARNYGFAGGVNRALGAARGRLILLLNPDCQLSPNAIAELRAYLDANPEVAAAAPLLHGTDGSSQREFQLRRLPTFRSTATELLMLDELSSKNVTASHHRYRELAIDRPQFVEQPAAAALMIRREVMERIGGFDERFAPAWFEDVDYCRRLAAAGEKIALVPSATAEHHGGSSLEHLSFDEFTTVWYRNLYLYASKWFRPREVERLRWLIIFGMLLRVAALSLGFSKKEAPRRVAIRAYTRVMRQAFERWSQTSRSS